MNTSARSSRLVTGLAVAGVTIAALGAVASSWIEPTGRMQRRRPCRRNDRRRTNRCAW
jgi:hypothetical protein